MPTKFQVSSLKNVDFTNNNNITKVGKDVAREPPLLPVNPKHYPAGSNTSDDARPDVCCRGIWAPLDKAFLVRCKGFKLKRHV